MIGLVHLHHREEEMEFLNSPIYKNEMWRLKGKTKGLSWVLCWYVDYNITIFWVCVWFWVGSGFVVELGLC